MFKNVASQKVALFAFDITTGAPKTGDAANITPYVSKDYGSVTVLGTTTATEMDSTNAKGWYSFVLTQGETNGDALLFTAKSSTSNIVLVGLLLFTTPPNFSSASIDSNGRVDIIKINGTSQTARDIGASVLLSTGTGTGQLDFTSGVVKANATQWLGGTIPAVNVTGVPLVDAKYLLGTVFATPATAGIIDANAKNLGGTAQTGRDVGASVLLSTGTGTGQLDFTSGVVKANLAQILGTALTETAGQIAAAFKKVFDVASATFTALSVNQTGDAYARLGAPAGASVSADIAAVKAVLPGALTGAGNIKADALAINGVALAAQALGQSAQSICWGTCSGGTTTTAVVSTLNNPSSLGATGQLIGRTIIFLGNTGTANMESQASNITNSTTGATPTLTFTAMTTAPANGDVFVIL